MLKNIKQITNTCMNVISIFEKLDLLSHFSCRKVKFIYKPPEFHKAISTKNKSMERFSLYNKFDWLNGTWLTEMKIVNEPITFNEIQFAERDFLCVSGTSSASAYQTREKKSRPSLLFL